MTISGVDLSVISSFEAGKKFLNGEQAMLGVLVIAAICVAPTVLTDVGLE